MSASLSSSLSLLLRLPGWVGFRQCITHVPPYVSCISPLSSSLLLSHHGGTSLKSGLFLLFSPLLSSALHSVCLGVCLLVGMIVSATALLGATLGTVSGVLTLCGLSLLCKSCKKGKPEKGDETDPEKAKPSILHTLTQVRLTLTLTQPWTSYRIWHLNTYKRKSLLKEQKTLTEMRDIQRVKCSDSPGWKDGSGAYITQVSSLRQKQWYCRLLKRIYLHVSKELFPGCNYGMIHR